MDMETVVFKAKYAKWEVECERCGVFTSESGRRQIQSAIERHMNKQHPKVKRYELRMPVDRPAGGSGTRD